MNQNIKTDALKPAFVLTALKKRLAQVWLTIWNLIFGRHRYGRLVIEKIDTVSLIILPEVYNPVLFRTGAFLARAVKVTPFLSDHVRVLDLGCGSGAGAIFAAQRGARVIASDLNPEAVRCAEINAMLNHLEDRIETRFGDLFAPVENERFDLVLFNPPFYRGHPKDNLDMAWRGEKIFERFAVELKDHLTPTGLAMIVLSTDGDGQLLLVQLQANDFKLNQMISRDFGNEVITVYSVIPLTL